MRATLADLDLPLQRTEYYSSLDRGHQGKDMSSWSEEWDLSLDGDRRFQATQSTRVNPAGPIGHLAKETSPQEGRFTLSHAKEMGGIIIPFLR